jgi:hypothetical protein
MTQTIDLSMAGQEEYRVGQDVEGLYKNGIWYGAKINSIQEDGVYLIDWNDCDPQDRVKSFFRLRKRLLTASTGLSYIIDSQPTSGMSREELRVGLSLYLLMMADNDGPLFGGEMGDSQAEEGWKYFDTLTDASDCMSLPMFQVQMRKVAKRAVQEANLHALLERSMREAFDSSDLSGYIGDEKISQASKKLMQTMLNSIDVLTSAVFRMFGK